jgi:hypothetical protein
MHTALDVPCKVNTLYESVADPHLFDAAQDLSPGGQNDAAAAPTPSLLLILYWAKFNF